ncbi:MAG: ABC transporter ATP-binding protein [Parvibaculaceae bacterium]
MRSSVELQDVSKRYGSFNALETMSLTFDKGEYVVLLGPSGSGKTTLLSMLGGFCEPTTGRILIDGADVTRVPPAARPTVTVFQDYALFPHMTIIQNVAFGLSMRGVARAERMAQAEKALEKVGLGGFGGRKVHQISGGQRQRVALARAIVIRPAVLLLDEPLGALDVKIRRQMQDELRQLQRALGATFIHVTHDQEEAMSIADTVLLLNKGAVEDMGPPERVYKRPASVFTATFMGEANLLKGTVCAEAGGTVTVDTPLGRLPAAGSAAMGRAVHISIRPESIKTGKPLGAKGISLGTAVLGEIVFQGTHRRCKAEMEDAAGSPLLARLPPEASVEADARVDLWVSPEDIILVDEGGA